MSIGTHVYGICHSRCCNWDGSEATFSIAAQIAHVAQPMLFKWAKATCTICTAIKKYSLRNFENVLLFETADAETEK